MWSKTWREKAIQNIDRQWDMLIIGGGISGAGIFAEARRRNLKVLLVEQHDFCWGSSSKSSKMIHGGLRYLLQGDIGLTWQCANEREYLLKKYAGIIEPLSFLFPVYKFRKPARWQLSIFMLIYDLLARKFNHSYWQKDKVLEEVPLIAKEHLKGAMHFEEGVVDDVRFVLRLLHEGTSKDCIPLNYMKVDSLLKGERGVNGAILKDQISGQQYEVHSRIVINATGIWADQLRGQIGEKPCIRPLRGSHLIISSTRFPIKYTITYFHPKDGRPIFASPWEGAVLVGTTDIDHVDNISNEPSITQQEIEYLLQGINNMFPSLELTEQDIISSISGIRPIIDTGAASPSQERRDHEIKSEQGMLTVIGGKYTTFRLVANQTLSKVSEALKIDLPVTGNNAISQTPLSKYPQVSAATLERLKGYYGENCESVLSTFTEQDWQTVPETPILWGELRWAAKNEAVVHLDDLLLRRTRLGLLSRNGGSAHFDKIQIICQQELGWSTEHWEQQLKSYQECWRSHYSI